MLSTITRKNAMDIITQENFNQKYLDSIEVRQIDHFVCKEMGRQIHRYIKGMSGRKCIMEKFEEALSTLTVPEKEKAIARYIDLNRKSISGLDFKVVLARAVANYCDTFDYMLAFINNREKMQFYLDRILSKYICFHTVFEKDGKFGLRTCYTYVDDLITMPIIAEKNGKLGLILPDRHDTVVADFIYDDISLRDEYPYFEAKKGRKKVLLNDKGEIV